MSTTHTYVTQASVKLYIRSQFVKETNVIRVIKQKSYDRIL